MSSSLSVRSFQAQARNVVASLTGFGSASTDDASGVENGNGSVAQIHQAHQPQSEMMAIAEARLFTQQLMQHQMQNQDLRRTSLTGSSSGRSLFGSVLGRGATSTIGGGGAGTGTGSGGHSSPVLGSDEPSEQTLLLARPLWVQDQDAAACRICARTFNAVRRKHHCRQCGHIFCHDCSSRSIALPQLGYTKAVRVCNDCFEVAYLVAYCLSDDLGTSTQIHGARGLYELIETNDVKVLQNVLDHGGLDAMIYLCGSAHGYELHALATNSLAVLSENQMLASRLVKEGAMDSLMSLCVYFPLGVRSRAIEKAIRSIAQEHTRGGSDSTEYPEGEEVNRSPSPSPRAVDDGEPGMIAMDDMYHDRLESMQGVAAKCISVMAADVANQSFIVDDPERIDRLVQLLYSNNADVVKYASKTMAYLSLRNDKYKPDIVKGSGASALLSVIRMATGEHFQLETRQGASQAYSEAVSHACCALANLATNTESQEILMSQLDLVITTCSVVGIFPHQREVERHVARLIANLALYDQNKLSLLTAYTSTDANEASPQLAHHTLPHRYSSPPPPRRAKGNVIPTLLMIGALTLEWAGNPEEGEADRSYPYQGQDAIDFMNDDGTHSENPGYLTPNDSSSENEPSHQEGNEANGEQVEGRELLEWVTIRGMEDVQRHIIRAIDNLMTLVMEDPASHQSFKVFSRIWPTLGLIKAIQMANQDEDTQRRATHVMTTLIQQQQIHAETIAAKEREETESKKSVDPQERQKVREDEERIKQKKAKKEVEEEEKRRFQEEVKAVKAKEKEEAKAAKAKEEKAKAAAAKVKEEEDKARAKEEEEAKALALAKQEAKEAMAKATEAALAAKEAKMAEENASAKKERQIRETVELKKAEREKEKQEKLRQQAEEERQKIEQEKAAEEQRKQERRAEQERLETERLEQERLEQEHLEQKRLEKRRIKMERLEQERLENERLEQERLEKEHLEEEEHKQERLKEKTRVEHERLEQEREQERLEQERLERERLERERLEYQRLEEERVAKEKQGEALADIADQASALSSSMLSEEPPRNSSSKTMSSSEDQLSVDEAPRPAEKASKKPKKKKGRK
ncbi:hypothetical protein BGZ81_005437 [Podila clonocystis]|nr:hypothetical protein BGZ81_005437 [Podila clonocystis]